MSRCLACGWEHEPRPWREITDRDREDWRADRYIVPPPPVPTGYWQEDNWVRWAIGHGRLKTDDGGVS